ncbi:hypothetical protein HYW44_01625 [Candidatus Daviesbacteria bacterium]|nr:hypothetical protein [Candidatus Daviesbacteria bacterium]
MKYSVSSDIIYDLEESVSIHGDTGPYVIYVYARIQSLLKKADRAINNEAEESEDELQEEKIAQESSLLVARDSLGKKAKKTNAQMTKRDFEITSLEPEEREVLRYLEYFDFTISKATDNFQPNEITKYLLNLCKAFNLFYEKMPILGSKQEEFRLMLCKSTAENIKLGLYLLGIETVEKM